MSETARTKENCNEEISIVASRGTALVATCDYLNDLEALVEKQGRALEAAQKALNAGTECYCEDMVYNTQGIDCPSCEVRELGRTAVDALSTQADGAGRSEG